MGKRKKGKRAKRRAAMTSRPPRTGRSSRPAGGDRSSEAAPEELDDDEEDDLEPSSAQDDEPGAEADDPVEGEGDGEEDDGPVSGGGDGPPSGGGPPDGAGWARPLVRLEQIWTRVESVLLCAVLVTLIVLLCIWISLTGMSSSLSTPNSAGTVFRALVGAVLLGGLVHWITGRLRLSGALRTAITAGVALVACLLAPLWRPVGIDYFGGLLSWGQDGSALTLFGGLRGVATRLTILVALLGGSLAAAAGRHINIDVVVRFLRPSWRLPIGVASALATAAVCLVASWGFLDYVAIYKFHADNDAPMTAKVATIRHGVGEQLFILRHQAGLDLRAIPAVLSGTRWDAPERMNGREWNAWLDNAGYAERYSPEQMQDIRAPESALDEPRVPFVALPGGRTARGMLIPGMDLTFPVGLFLIGLRVLLRMLLALGGRVSTDPEAADSKDEDEEGPEDSPEGSTNADSPPTPEARGSAEQGVA